MNIEHSQSVINTENSNITESENEESKRMECMHDLDLNSFGSCGNFDRLFTYEACVKTSVMHLLVCLFVCPKFHSECIQGLRCQEKGCFYCFLRFICCQYPRCRQTLLPLCAVMSGAYLHCCLCFGWGFCESFQDKIVIGRDGC
jgi:hypothetical protein